MSNNYCPICQAPCAPYENNPAYPFCSHRCQLVDLDRWLDGDYRIPGEPLSDGTGAVAAGAAGDNAMADGSPLDSWPDEPGDR